MKEEMSEDGSDKTKISIKLLIDSKSNRVLFAEAGKDFADFLFTLLSLPVGSVVRLLSSNAMVGTIGKLYDSFRDLNDTYIQPQVNKDTLLKPSSSSSSPTILSLTNDTSSASPKELYSCNGCHRYYSDGVGAKCPSCQYSNSIGTKLTYVDPPSKANNVGSSSSSSEGGFVKGVVTYMVMDDLEVKPMSTISSITMLNMFNIKEVGALQEKTVSVGMTEGLKLLKSSLETKSVLTNVFLEK